MPERSWRSHAAFVFLAIPLLIAIPFAIFFLVMGGGAWDQFGDYYLIALIFTLAVNLAVQVNSRWIVPMLPRTSGEGGGAPNLVLHIASFAVVSLAASLLTATALHFTIMPQMLGSTRAVLRLVIFALLFTALFLGIIYSFFFQRRLVERIRAEAEREAREGQEMRVAAEIQQALLPPRSRAGSWYDAAGASIPCRTIGGDFFEYFDLPDGRVGFALADVAGKGPPAALLAAMVQGIFDSHARRGAGPAATMSSVNEAIAAREIEARFATLFYAVLGPSGELVFSNAGHNPPVVLRRRDVVRRLETGGLMLGPFKGATFEEERSMLEPGDVLVVYSDGVTDAEGPDGEQFGEERLLECLAGPPVASVEAVRDRLLDAVKTFASDRPLFDDVTVLAVRYLGPRP
ncbi:MAG TPA: PP2C family protein-serine/threonine phosphatase [Candidatus Eisenbacteria bacterium]|nr:PP2C family protein-serine/threonine phosphatase [Candidatus Eisenbacteria bacterium]